MKKLLLAFLLLNAVFTFCQEKVEDDFEGNGTITSWFGDDCEANTSLSNPFQTGINTSDTVLEYKDTGGQYANVRFDVPKNFDLSVNHTFTLKIYVPSSSLTGTQANQVSLKLQNNTIGAPWSTQTEIIKTITLDEWQTVSFDFLDDNYININANSRIPTERIDLNRVLIQVNGEDNQDRVTAYIDDFSYDGVLPEAADESDDDMNFDTMVWWDEFDGQGEQVVDLDNSKWFKQTYPILGGDTWANGEVQHYTDRIDNSYISDGTLKILAKRETYWGDNKSSKDFTSARLNSKFAFTYGRVEIRAKMPFGVGTFPALWMLGQNITETGGYWAETHGTIGWPDCGEIDIIEHWGDNQNFVQSALHNRSSFGGTVNKGGRMISNASSDFHIYTLEWNSEKMIFSVDGVEHYTYNPQNKNIENWPYDEPQYILMNVAILPNITSSFTESAMEIDYVRVYQKGSGLGLDSNKLENEIQIFPNPTKGDLTIKAKNDVNNAYIFDLTGKRIHTIHQRNFSQTHNLSFLKNGLYFLRVETSSSAQTFKIVKN